MNFLELPDYKIFIKNFLELDKHKYFFHGFFKTDDFSDENIENFIKLTKEYCSKGDDFLYNTDIEKHIYSFISEVWENIDKYYYFLNYGTDDIFSIVKFDALYRNKNNIEKWLESVGLDNSKFIKKIITQKENKIKKYKNFRYFNGIILFILFLIFIIFVISKFK